MAAITGAQAVVHENQEVFSTKPGLVSVMLTVSSINMMELTFHVFFGIWEFTFSHPIQTHLQLKGYICCYNYESDVYNTIFVYDHVSLKCPQL